MPYKRYCLIGLFAGMEVLYGITDAGEVLLESLLRDNDRAAAVIGVKRERGSFLQTAVEEKDDMVIGIINESERTDRTGFESQIAHHPLG